MFGAVKLTNHPDINQYKYSGYCIGIFSYGKGSGINVIVFGVDMSSSPHIGNKKKDILIPGKDPTEESEHTLTAEKLYSINFTKHNKKFCLSLHYNGANSYLFVMVQKLLNLKQKILKLYELHCAWGTPQKTFL